LTNASERVIIDCTIPTRVVFVVLVVRMISVVNQIVANEGQLGTAADFASVRSSHRVHEPGVVKVATIQRIMTVVIEQ
jgi:hypothetical protein